MDRKATEKDNPEEKGRTPHTFGEEEQNIGMFLRETRRPWRGVLEEYIRKGGSQRWGCRAVGAMPVPEAKVQCLAKRGPQEL